MITKKQLHKHFWILDKNSFGRCRCGATRQFFVEEKAELRRSEIATLNRLARLALHHPDSWITGTCEMKFD